MKLTTTEKIYELADELRSLSGQLDNAAQLHREDIANLEAKLEDAIDERDEARAQIDGFTEIMDAVSEFLDRRESPAPEIRDRALEYLQEVFNRVNR